VHLDVSQSGSELVQFAEWRRTSDFAQEDWVPEAQYTRSKDFQTVSTLA
jgi:hypothetical protein